MSVEREPGALERRLTSLLAELGTSPAQAPGNLAAGVVRRARRQRAAFAVMQLLFAVARSVPDAIAIGAGRRR